MGERKSILQMQIHRKMTIEEYIKQNYEIKCEKGEIEIKVKIYRKPGSSIISSLVECPYNYGGHGQKCKKGKICGYSIDIPYKS